jgi:hypothetical protein
VNQELDVVDYGVDHLMDCVVDYVMVNEVNEIKNLNQTQMTTVEGSGWSSGARAEYQ